MYHLLPMFLVCIKVRQNKVLSIRVFAALILKISLHIYYSFITHRTSIVFGIIKYFKLTTSKTYKIIFSTMGNHTYFH
jgi:hypothetical protein